MNKKIEVKRRRERVAGPKEETNRTDSPALRPNAFPAEDVLVTDDQMGNVYKNPQAAAEDGAVLFIQDSQPKEDEEEEEEYKTTNLDALLAAWWKYKRENKHKKKRRKLVKIYRDENYWNDGRYTDEEDFNYCES